MTPPPRLRGFTISHYDAFAGIGCNDARHSRQFRQLSDFVAGMLCTTPDHNDGALGLRWRVVLRRLFIAAWPGFGSAAGVW